jgi:hypothetical protein
MKSLIFAFIVLLSCFANYAQDSKPAPYKFFEYEDECVSPFAESQTYGFWIARIIRIKDGRSLVFERGSLDGKPVEYTVYLAGVDPKDNQRLLKKFLSENVLNKSVTISGNLEKNSYTSFFGTVSTDEIKDVSRHILENGMARYAEPKYPYSVSLYDLCVYQIAAREARAKQIGIWAR